VAGASAAGRPSCPALTARAARRGWRQRLGAALCRPTRPAFALSGPPPQVEQFDTLLPVLTVEEMLLYTSEASLCGAWSGSKERVESRCRERAAAWSGSEPGGREPGPRHRVWRARAQGARAGPRGGWWTGRGPGCGARRPRRRARHDGLSLTGRAPPPSRPQPQLKRPRSESLESKRAAVEVGGRWAPRRPQSRAPDLQRGGGPRPFPALFPLRPIPPPLHCATRS
jgi:hypothetical protein